MRKFVCAVFLTLITLSVGRYVFAQSTIDQKVNDLAKPIIDEFPQTPKTRIAVVGFVNDEGRFNCLRNYLRREIASPLFASKKFTILEREFIDKIIEQNKIELDPVFNPDAAKKLGDLLGADVLLIGVVTNLGRDLPVRVKARCYSARTGEQVADATANIPRVEQLKSLLSDDCAGEGGGEAGQSRQREAAKIVPNSIEVELLKCRRDVNTVICQLRLTNKSSTSPVGRVHFGYSTLMDESSNVARLKQVLKDGNLTPYFEIASGSTVQVELSFEGVSFNAKKVTVIEIVVNGGKVTYTNICLAGFCGGAR